MDEQANGHTDPKSLPLFERGIHTATDFARAMSALMSDLAARRVTPGQGNAICNAGGKLLKVVELQLKHGTDGNGAAGALMLAPPADSPPTPTPGALSAA